jgi:hypothetical protein
MRDGWGLGGVGRWEEVNGAQSGAGVHQADEKWLRVGTGVSANSHLSPVVGKKVPGRGREEAGKMLLFACHVFPLPVLQDGVTYIANIAGPRWEAPGIFQLAISKPQRLDELSHHSPFIIHHSSIPLYPIFLCSAHLQRQRPHLWGSSYRRMIPLRTSSP